MDFILLFDKMRYMCIKHNDCVHGLLNYVEYNGLLFCTNVNLFAYLHTK
jgi:hypothetical protein